MGEVGGAHLFEPPALFLSDFYSLTGDPLGSSKSPQQMAAGENAATRWLKCTEAHELFGFCCVQRAKSTCTQSEHVYHLSGDPAGNINPRLCTADKLYPTQLNYVLYFLSWFLFVVCNAKTKAKQVILLFPSCFCIFYLFIAWIVCAESCRTMVHS